MDNRLTDLSHPVVAAQSRNKTAIAGTCTMNTVLAAAYIAEVLKGVRSLPSYLIFLLLCLLPCVTSILAYTKQKDTSSVRYLCGGGFALLYAYVMFTSSTDLTFCYVIVMLLILLVYLCTGDQYPCSGLSCRYTGFHRCPDYQCRDYNRLHYPFLYFCIDVCHKDCADQRCQHQKG